MSNSWMNDAACRYVGDSDLWFPPKGGRSASLYEQARRICRTCPVIDECLQFAMRTEETSQGYQAGRMHRHGMYGGLTPLERDRLATEKRPYTPPKRRAS